MAFTTPSSATTHPKQSSVSFSRGDVNVIVCRGGVAEAPTVPLEKSAMIWYDDSSPWNYALDVGVQQSKRFEGDWFEKLVAGVMDSLETEGCVFEFRQEVRNREEIHGGTDGVQCRPNLMDSVATPV